MKCPFCGHTDDRVLDTRIQKDGEQIRRRRECLNCKSRFTTLEGLLLNYPFIIKKDDRREPYSKEKLLKGIQAACQKRPVSLSQMESLVEKISLWFLNRQEKEISAQLIGQKVMQELKQLDDVAYIRFASVYRTFKDVQEFVETLDEPLVDNDFNDPQLILSPSPEEKPHNETSRQRSRSTDTFSN